MGDQEVLLSGISDRESSDRYDRERIESDASSGWSSVYRITYCECRTWSGYDRDGFDDEACERYFKDCG